MLLQITCQTLALCVKWFFAVLPSAVYLVKMVVILSQTTTMKWTCTDFGAMLICHHQIECNTNHYDIDISLFLAPSHHKTMTIISTLCKRNHYTVWVPLCACVRVRLFHLERTIDVHNYTTAVLIFGNTFVAHFCR